MQFYKSVTRFANKYTSSIADSFNVAPVSQFATPMYQTKKFFSNTEQPVSEVHTKEEILNVLHNASLEKLRNIAIIAHVDHGKTTLVDALITQSGAAEGEKKSMDSNALEQEKGITILSKCTGVAYKNHKINIVDTPGHHDFGGEVERIMSMVDGVALLICAVEGPMTQTKFVLEKALRQNLKPIIIINKVDRPGARVQEVENEIFDLFCSLDAPDEILDYPIYYASAKNGWAVKDLDGENRVDCTSILDGIIEHIPHPNIDPSPEFTMLVSQTESHPFFGKLLIGRVNSGTVKTSDKVVALDDKGNVAEIQKVFKILRRYGMSHLEIPHASAGDIISIAGFESATVTNTLNEPGKNKVLPSIPIDPPMLSIFVSANTSPLAGKEGTMVSGGKIKDRLLREQENDVALKVSTSSTGGKTSSTAYEIQGRGDLHLGILIERMRREGFEMAITPPSVVMKEVEKKKMEPVEVVSIDVDPMYIAPIIENMNDRKGILVTSESIEDDMQRIIFHCPTRGLIGLRSQLLNDTRGTAILHTEFLEYQDYKGPLKKNLKGALISNTEGVCQAFGLKEIENKGTLFVKPGMKVYGGVVIGESKTEEDMELNPTKEKKVTNIRTTAAEEKITLQPPRVMSLEESISYCRDDEIIEVTPQAIRLRKKELDPSQRKKNRRDTKNANQKFKK